MPEQSSYVYYGRRKGRPLRTNKTALMQTLLPAIEIAPGEAAIDPATLFPNAREVWLEVGFGTGEHLATLAKEDPDVGFIGAEPFRNGIAGLVGLIDEQKLANIRIYPDDARPLLDRIAPGSLGKVFVLFADPWPKKRHAERRFIGPTNLPKLERVLKPGGELRAASDDPILQAWMEEQLLAYPGFNPAPGAPAFESARPQGWPPTRYEQKSLAKHKPGWVGHRYYSYWRKTA